MKEMLVFTGVFGKGDALHDPALPLLDLDFVCWTDLDFEGKSRWWMIKRNFDDLPPVKRNRRVKIFFQPNFNGYEYSLYLDSTVRLLVDPRQLISFLQPGSDIAVFDHPARDCLYEEAREVIRRGLDDADVVWEQVTRYRGEGILPHAGLWACTVILRRHTPSMQEFCQAWWKEVEAFSCRDQISFPYVVAKSGVKVSTFPGSLLCNDFIDWRPWERSRDGWIGREGDA